MTKSAFEPTGLRLADGHSGSSLLYSALCSAAADFPELSSCALPRSARDFRRSYRDALVRFEAARLASARRVEIAQRMVAHTSSLLAYDDGRRSIALSELIAHRVAPLPLVTVKGTGRAGLVPAVAYEGHVFAREALNDLTERWYAEHRLSRPVVNAVRWIVDRTGESGGMLDLTGHRFVLLGAGAELAPTRLLLEAGAEVLWLDLRPPPEEIASGSLPGTLMFPPRGADLLSQPARLLSTIAELAGPAPVHLGLYAYAPGASRELRLTASMNAIVQALPPSRIQSISLLVSPTTPSTIRGLEDSFTNGSAPLWQRVLSYSGVLAEPHPSSNGARVAHSIVPVQGASYQAAQYLGKLLAAEVYATRGTSLLPDRVTPVTVSANVAPITKTRSLAHPLFEAAFIGAEHFGVEMWEPETTRQLSALLMLHDVLNPEAPGAASCHYPDERARAAGVFSQQVHGGLFRLPYRLDSAIAVAAALGLAARPRLAFGLARR